MDLKNNGKTFKEVIDSGADFSVNSTRYWPKGWALLTTPNNTEGIGHISQLEHSAQYLQWQDEEGKQDF